MKSAISFSAWCTLILCSSACADDAFNGKNFEGWMVKPENPAVWQVIKDKNGEPMIARQPVSSYLWTKRKFADFTLELEYMVSPGCNSGVFFRSDPDNPVQGGFEIQIFDSHGQDPTRHNTGALYDASPASHMPENPANQWNTFKLTCQGPKISVHINGVLVQDVDIDRWVKPRQNPDGSENKFKTALKDLPRTGHIGFQDHGHNVWYRRIRIVE